MAEISPLDCAWAVVGACCLIWFFSIKQNPARVNSRDRPKERERERKGGDLSATAQVVELDIHPGYFQLGRLRTMRMGAKIREYTEK